MILLRVVIIAPYASRAAAVQHSVIRRYLKRLVSNEFQGRKTGDQG
jgi:hypothetical protein